MDEIQETIVNRIKQAREDSKKTQKEIALVLGYKSANAISEIERGNVNVSAKDIYKLATFYNKPILYFYGRDFADDEIVSIIERLTDREIIDLKKLAEKMESLRNATPNFMNIDPNNLTEEDRTFLEKSRNELNEQLELLARQLEYAVKGRDQLEELLMIRPNSLM